jgi:cytochrome d ubiquinol oxidase subunit II
MQGTQAETAMDGFDFADTWSSVDGEYPILRALDQTAQLEARPLTRDPPTSIHEGMAGDGSARDPYVVTGVDELKVIDEDPVAFYELENNIDASAFDSTAVAATTFFGTFDGSDQLIDSLTISQQDSDQVGLFGEMVASATVKNITLNGLEVTVDNIAGGLAGQSTGIVRGVVIVSGTISEDFQTGGMIGENYGTMEQTGFEGTVSSSDNVGGLVGYNGNTIQSSYATGSAEGSDSYVGGLAGQNHGLIADTYSLAEVVGKEEVGGLVGYNDNPVDRSFAAEIVAGNETVGGFAGTEGIGSATDCYWDLDTTGLEFTAAGAEGLTTSEMQGTQAETAMDGFDFGIGMLYAVHDDEHDRETLLAAFGPVWDANEVWLVAFGTMLLAAFPRVYSKLLADHYLVAVGFVLALLFRGVAPELREQREDDRWQRACDRAFVAGSTLAPLLFGLLAGSWLFAVSPLSVPAVLTGVGLVALSVVTGASFLAAKTPPELAASVSRYGLVATVGYLGGVVVLLGVVVATDPGGAASTVLSVPSVGIVVLSALAGVTGIVFARRGQYRSWLVSAFALPVLLGTLVATLLYPTVYPATGLTVEQAVVSPLALNMTTVFGLPVLLVVFWYSKFLYAVFTAQVETESSPCS